jgi:predicted RNase H-like nuclease
VSPGRRRRGPDLPYDLLAGVVLSRGGWLVAGGKLVGTGLFPEEPFVAKKLLDVIDAVPSYSIIALAAPIGLPDKPTIHGRAAEREARRILGWPRLGAILSAPALPVALKARNFDEALSLNGGHLSRITWGQINRIREVRDVVQPHIQRNVYEVHPELSFHQLNGDRSLSLSKRSHAGHREREKILATRMPNLGSRLQDDPPRGSTKANVLDAYAALWTTRRIAARAATRVPDSPEWNAEGLRLEITR